MQAGRAGPTVANARAFRIVVAAHGELAPALLSAAELICGPIDDSYAVTLAPHETPDHLAERLRSAIGRGAERVLVLTDLLGGTPYNIAAAIARRSDRVVCLAGANLGMVVEAALATGPLDDALIERLLESGRRGIVETSRHHARRAS